MINFELPRDATGQLLRELREISPDFDKRPRLNPCPGNIRVSGTFYHSRRFLHLQIPQVD
jgi:hypothetical protein